MTYRPIGERLRSVFRDYWTQVSEAERFLEVGEGLSPHRQRVVSGYLKDSRNYRSPNGAIRGRLWFLVFAKFGPGMPFFLRDLFSSPAELKEALDNGSIAVLPTEDIDAFTDRFLGVDPSNRGRVSKPGNSDAVEKAFRQARSIVRLLSRRDRKYADIMTRHLARTQGILLDHKELISGLGK
jgi:hypothetical protein